VTVLNSSVLVLNRFYQPVHVTTVRRAFTLLVAGAARVMDRQFQLFDFPSWASLGAQLGEDCIHTPTRVLRAPRIIVLLAFDRIPRGRIRFSRYNIYARDGMTCQYCNKVFDRTQLNLDHVIPRSRGGRTTWENVVCSCIPCNMRKGGRTPAEAGMTVRNIPTRPKWSPLFRLPRNVRFEEWKPFLDPVDASYWNTELLD
jgi:5-methylcytosine-specific restriction endonuclease McrA